MKLSGNLSANPTVIAPTFRPQPLFTGHSEERKPVSSPAKESILPLPELKQHLEAGELAMEKKQWRRARKHFEAVARGADTSLAFSGAVRLLQVRRFDSWPIEIAPDLQDEDGLQADSLVTQVSPEVHLLQGKAMAFLGKLALERKGESFWNPAGWISRVVNPKELQEHEMKIKATDLFTKALQRMKLCIPELLMACESNHFVVPPSETYVQDGIQSLNARDTEIATLALNILENYLPIWEDTPAKRDSIEKLPSFIRGLIPTFQKNQLFYTQQAENLATVLMGEDTPKVIALRKRRQALEET